MTDSYTPVQYEFRELIQDLIAEQKSGKVFYFVETAKIDSAEGKLISLDEISGEGLFITLEPEAKIRIDRIVTLFGKPGAAYDEYAALGNSCMECHGGYDDL
jgi:hypothetical protein